MQKCKMRRRCVLRPRICTKTALQYCFPHENPTTFGTHFNSNTTSLVNTFFFEDVIVYYILRRYVLFEFSRQKIVKIELEDCN